MKCKKYILLLFTFAFTLFLAGCESGFTEALVSPSIEIKRVPTMSQTEITVAFTPSRTVARYEYAIGDESDMEAFLNGTLAGIVNVDNGEPVEAKFPGLTQNSVHTIFARAYGVNGAAGPVASIKEKTRGPSSPIEAEIQYQGENSIAVNITADMSYFKYDYAIGYESDLADFEDGTLSGMGSRSEFSKYTANFFNLEPGTDYIVFLRGYDRTSNLPTETVKMPVRTADRGTVPAVDCKIEDINLYAGKYMITPNEHVGKVSVTFTLKGELDKVINEEFNWKGNIIQMLEYWTDANTNDGSLHVGFDMPFRAEFTTPEMLLGQYDPYNYPIEAFVLVYDKDEKPFAVQKFNFNTPMYDNNAGEAKVELRITNITQNGALYEFIPNEHTLGMFFETFDAEWVHETMQSDYYYEGYIEYYLYYVRGYWIYNRNAKVSTYPERQAEPGKKYYVFYMAMNGNGTDGFGPLNYQIYETLPADEADK